LFLLRCQPLPLLHTHMGTPYVKQVAGKQMHCESLLAGHASVEWSPPLASQEHGLRNKARMLLGGTPSDRP
jgi:23S rRNA (uracil747-C5)-methyltransferase